MSLHAKIEMASATKTVTDEQHRLRRKRIERTALAGIAAKAAMLLPTLAIAKVAIPLVGAERFGVLMTALSLLAFLTIADLGIGASLVTSISRAFGAGLHDRVRQLQTNGLAVVGGVGVATFAAGTCLMFSDIGSVVFPGSSLPVRIEATQTLSVFTMLFGLGLPLTLITKIQLGLQRGHIANQWQVAAALVNFALGSLAALSGLGVHWIIAGMMSGTLSCGLANLVQHYLLEPRMRPQRADIDGSTLREVLHDASFYFLLQIIFTIAYAADTLLVARQLGAEQASTFALAERVFSIVAVAVSIVTGPLWAAYGEALGSGDSRWARRTLLVSTARIALAALALSLVLLAAIQPLIKMLSSGHLEVPFALALMMALWRVLEAVGSSLSVYMFASKQVRFLLIAGATTAAVSFVAKVLLLPAYGLASIPAAMFLCYAVFCLLPSALKVRYSSSTFSTERPQ